MTDGSHALTAEQAESILCSSEIQGNAFDGGSYTVQTVIHNELGKILLIMPVCGTASYFQL